jgi:hypothetical protein
MPFFKARLGEAGLIPDGEPQGTRP